MRLVLLALACFLPVAAASPCLSQSQTAREPEVSPDRAVTFRLLEPTAQAVAVAVEGTAKPLPMTRNQAGLWTLTTAPLAPEWYSYHFVVDGRTELDARNPTVKASYVAVGNGFLVPGTPAQPWEVAAVPHGTVHHHAYTTHTTLGLPLNQSEFYVYTPPGYDARAAAKYPVLYLLHGYSDTAAGWTMIGHANDIFDTLIASGKARPMVVVMPLGYGDMDFLRKGFGVWTQADVITHNTALFTDTLRNEILPQVEALYNVSTRREDRAIAGLSMGGLESLTIGLNHTEQFAWIGGFSAAVHMLTPAALAGYHPATADLKLLWIACGTEDDLITPNRRLVGVLKAEGAPVTAIETPGMHTWLVWRDNLVHFAPLLFQPGKLGNN